MVQIQSMKCPRCGRPFTPPFIPRKGGKVYCKDCTNIIVRVNLLEHQLIEQDFSIEQEDAHIARQINDILIKERSGITLKDEELLNTLTVRMIQDEKRRKKILKHISRLQKEKR